MDALSNCEMRNSHSASLLSTITDHWQAQGWSIDDLDAFRMEGETAPAEAPNLDAIIDQSLADEPAAPATTPEPATPAATTPEPPAAADPFDTGADSFDRSYVEGLRQENAKYRTERNTLQETFGQAFDGYDEADRDTLLAVARGLRSDDPAERAAVAEWLRTTGESLATPAPVAAPVGDDVPLTKAQLDQILAERDQQKTAADSQAQRLAAVNKEITDLGLTPGSTDTQVVLSIALHETNGDIKAAHDKLKARDQAAVDRWIASKEAEAENGAVVVPTSGASAEAPAKITSIKDAEAALEARFDAIGFK